MNETVCIAPLSAHLEALPILQRWFEEEGPDYYGPSGPGNAAEDLRAFANQDDQLPFAVVALRDGAVCGVAALKAHSIPSHSHLAPWAAAGIVHPTHRRSGIGAQLLAALEHEAKQRGYEFLYCGTNTAEPLFQRQGWRLLERIAHEGQTLGIYRKAL